MSHDLSEDWIMIIEALPSSLALILTELSLIVLGIVAEKHYVSRLTSFTNAIALTIHVLSRQEVGFWTGLYIDIGVLIGLVGLVAYFLEIRLHGYYYDISYLFYSSLSVGLVIAFSAVSLVIPLVFAAISQLLLIMVSDRTLIHDGEYSGAVKRFHQNNTFRLTDHRGVHEYDFSGWFE